MADIRVLDPGIYNKIAAGEVVEKPASVVKELVENALDAGATIISIAITGGGLEQIEVVDNGEGIAVEQLSKVFLPHATSKLQSDNQLFCIATLGFRGEAMASIAAVSQVTLTSRVVGQSAYRITADGTGIGQPQPVGADFGTSVSVRNLFYHTPARLKFLRSEKSETHDITAYVQRLLLANPTVSFHYTVDGKTVYSTGGNGLDEAVHTVFGQEAIPHLLPIDTSEYGYSVCGYVSDTLYSVGTRSQQITVVNGRVVQNANLSAAIGNVYRDYLMKRQFPLYVLHITLPYDEVDVNVHPTKADVRFQYANKLFGLIYRSVSKALEDSLSSRTLFFDQPTSPAQHSEQHIELSNTANCIDDIYTPPNHYRQNAFFEQNTMADNYWQQLQTQHNNGDLHNEELTAADATLQPEADVLPTTSAPNVHTWRLVGQVLGTYLVVEMDGDMLLVDQHAAAERVLYDQLIQHYTSDQVPVQPLLIPYSFTLPEPDADELESRLAILASLGVDIVKVGWCRFQINAIPSILTDMDMDAFVRYILEVQPDTHTQLFKEKLAYAACRSAVKGNTYMDNDAITAMCNNLFAHGLPGQCPHGRPAYVLITRRQLEHMFRRLV